MGERELEFRGEELLDVRTLDLVGLLDDSNPENLQVNIVSIYFYSSVGSVIKHT